LLDRPVPVEYDYRAFHLERNDLKSSIKIQNVELGKEKLFLFAGPCVIESLGLIEEVAASLKEICKRLDVPFVFKASFDKANRSSLSGYRGPGIEHGLEALAMVKESQDVPIITDIHEPQQAKHVAEVADIIQIPAFLCRQTDLVLAAAETGLPVNIKKGQYMAPWDMLNILKKAESTGNENIFVTERGSSFGYNNLVVDMRSLALMSAWGCPVVFDATHSVQKPGGLGDASGGDSELAPALACAAVAAGADGFFFETHPDPANALCDGPNMIPLADLESLLEKLLRVKRAVTENAK